MNIMLSGNQPTESGFYFVYIPSLGVGAVPVEVSVSVAGITRVYPEEDSYLPKKFPPRGCLWSDKLVPAVLYED